MTRKVYCFKQVPIILFFLLLRLWNFDLCSTKKHIMLEVKGQ